MPPIAFQSNIKDNYFIEIPEQYRKALSARVLVTIKPIPQTRQKKISPPFIHTKGWKFDRDEANER
jgi:hypothetical protein